MTFHIITIFPQIFNSYFDESILKRAQDAGLINIKIYDLRGWTTDKHRSVDDTPYGGGAGMVMKVDVLYRAIQNIKSHITHRTSHIVDCSPDVLSENDPRSAIRDPRIILTSAKGKTWKQPMAREYAKLNDIIIICGRYEGVDERITNFIDEEISIGDYVLTGGEIPAMAMVDSITRLLPGVLGNPDSLNEESFSQKFDIRHSTFDTCLEYPQYTKPEVFKDKDGKEYKVPDILLSGNHAEIAKWREGQKKKK